MQVHLTKLLKQIHFNTEEIGKGKTLQERCVTATLGSGRCKLRCYTGTTGTHHGPESTCTTHSTQCWAKTCILKNLYVQQFLQKKCFYKRISPQNNSVCKAARPEQFWPTTCWSTLVPCSHRTHVQHVATAVPEHDRPTERHPVSNKGTP